ncbi:DegV family protein [Streptococcus catagoni]|uniref:DegV family protein n=1 Tax=Streptococcus catagoni TaxID=2654874 RepID=UPI00140723F1|nr:DegV family protein [Streptococcus catagoni]
MFTLMTDSTADLTKDWLETHPILRLGLTVELDGKIYETLGEDALSTQYLLEQMKKGSQPKTSQINVGQFEEVFRDFAKKNQALLYLAFSSVLSGTYQSAVMAREMVLADYPKATIEIVDTLAAAGGESLLVMEAAKARQAGKTIEETRQLIEDLSPRLRSYFLVDDLHHLERGGRLSKSSAILGSLAHIKPLLSISAEGKLVPIAKFRGRKKASKELLKLTVENLSSEKLLISYTGSIDSAEGLKEEFLQVPAVKEVLILPIGPVVSAHLGEGTLAVFSIGQEARK